MVTHHDKHPWSESGEKPFFWNLIHFWGPPVPSTNLPEGCSIGQALVKHLEKAELKGTLLVAVRSSFAGRNDFFRTRSGDSRRTALVFSCCLKVSQAQVQHLEAFLSELRSDPDCQSYFSPFGKKLSLSSWSLCGNTIKLAMERRFQLKFSFLTHYLKAIKHGWEILALNGTL